MTDAHAIVVNVSRDEVKLVCVCGWELSLSNGESLAVSDLVQILGEHEDHQSTVASGRERLGE